jgi:hypothetical protein
MKVGEWTARPPAGSAGWWKRHPCGPRIAPTMVRAHHAAPGESSSRRGLSDGRRLFDSPHQGVEGRQSRTDYRTRAERVFDRPDEALKLRTMIREITGTRPAGQRMLEEENKRKKTDTSRDRNVSGRKIQLFDYQCEFAARPWLQGLVTVTRGVGRGVGRVVTRGTEATSTHHPARNLLMRASTSARGRPNRARLVSISRWMLCRRACGAS